MVYYLLWDFPHYSVAEKRGDRVSTLYVSDLDGTLLRSNEATSEYTNSVINRLTDQGMMFSYWSAHLGLRTVQRQILINRI